MRIGRERWLDAGLITLVTALAYGALVGQLGFYRDDWYLFSTAQSQGPAGIVALFQIDRPLIGYLYALGYRMFGIVPLAWQAAALVARLAGNLAFVWLLRLLWPDRRAETLAMALLFAVYPGFTVEPNAGVYVTDLVASASALLSMALMLKALQSARPGVWILLSMLAGSLELLYLGIFESAIGLEAARFGLLWFVAWRQNTIGFRRALAPALRAELPYAVVAIAFLAWRLFIFHSTRRTTNLGVLVGRYTTSPAYSALSVLVETLKDVLETTVFSWTVPFYQFVSTSNYRDLPFSVVLGLLAAVSVFAAMRRSLGAAPDGVENSQAHRKPHSIWLGTLIVVFALLPINMAGRNVLFADQWDRYTLYASSGVALVAGGLLFHLAGGRARRIILALLVGMSVMVHYFSAAGYRDLWLRQRDLWQQMVWRAPGIQRGTMLFVATPGMGYVEGYEIYAPANMVYYPGESIQLGGEVLNSATAAELQLQKNRQHYDRTVLVPDNYRNALIAVHPGPQSCLHLLDGRKVELPGFVEDSLVADVASYSRIDLIQVSARAPVLPAFLHGGSSRPWCAYYQKMDLARQAGDWAEVARLADEAQGKGLKAEDVSEWMPALESFTTLDRLADARHAASIIRSVDGARAFLCLQLQRGAAYPPPYDYNRVNQVLCQAN